MRLIKLFASLLTPISMCRLGFSYIFWLGVDKLWELKFPMFVFVVYLVIVSLVDYFSDLIIESRNARNMVFVNERMLREQEERESDPMPWWLVVAIAFVIRVVILVVYLAYKAV